MNVADLHWAAGLLEGEGSFGVARPSASRHLLYPYVQASMTDLEPLEKLQRVLGGRITGPFHKKTERGRDAKPFWSWQAGGQRNAAAVMMTLFPLLSPRRQARIEEVLLAWRTRPMNKRRAA